MALNSDLNAHKRICTCTYNQEDGELSVKRSHTFLISITALPEKAMVKLKGRGVKWREKKREVPSGEVIKRGGRKNREHRKLAAVQRGRVLCLLRLQMAVAGKAAKHTMPCGQMATHNSLTGNSKGGGAKGQRG